MQTRTLRSSAGWISAGFILAMLSAPQLCRAQCDVLFGPAFHFPAGPYSTFMVSGDFNEDGILDLAVANDDYINNGLNSSVAILLGMGGHSYSSPVMYAAGHNSIGLAAGDFNGDDILDLAVANTLSSNVSILIGRGAGGVGDGTFAPPVQVPVSGNPFGIVAADFDGDGITDLATCLNVTSGIALLKGLGSGGVGNGAFTVAAVLPINSVSTGLKTGDLNLDGVMDLVATEIYTGTVAVLFGTGSARFGSGSFGSAIHVPVLPSPFGIGLADLNADGNLDLIVAHTNGQGIRVLLGSPTGSFTPGVALAAGNCNATTTADLDQDGNLDLVTGTVTGYNTGLVEVYRGHGDGTFDPVQTYDSGGDAYQIVADDFDGDGRTDIFVSEAYGTNVNLLPGLCADAPPDTRAPVLTAVRDVPNDQGGKVFLTWMASSLDVPNGAVREYRVWRRIPPTVAHEAVVHQHAEWLVVPTVSADGSTSITYWEALITLPAQRLSGYGYTAPTTQDSMSGANPYTAFFVSALTSNIDVFYSSNVDSGYSVDNLKPQTPSQLTGQPVDGGYALQWDESADPDLDRYQLYRGATEDFAPSDENRIASLTAVGYLDPGAIGAAYYKLSAVDRHDNESDFAMLPPFATTAVDRRDIAFSLRGARPNPSRGAAWTIDLSVSRAGAARLEVIDVAGRRVISRDLDLDPGSHAVTLPESAKLPSGVYLVRFTQGGARREVKAVRVD